MTNCSPEQLQAIGAGLRRSVEVIDRAPSLIRNDDKSVAPVLEFFLGKSDANLRTALLTHAAGRAEEDEDLGPERYTCTEGAGGAKFIPINQDSPGRYEFEDVEPEAAPGPRAPDELTSAGDLALRILLEATHDHIVKTLGDWEAPDFSHPHGVVSILPALAGVDPLRNAESVASVAISLGLGEFSAMKLQAVRSMHAPGRPGLERKLQASVVGYAGAVHLLVRDQFKSTTRTEGAMCPWVRELVDANLATGCSAGTSTGRRCVGPGSRPPTTASSVACTS